VVAEKTVKTLGGYFLAAPLGDLSLKLGGKLRLILIPGLGDGRH